jgi:hypothetical protein
MADEEDIEDDDDLNTEIVDETDAIDAPEQEAGSEDPDIEDEDVISIEGDAPPQEEETKTAPKWVKDLRKSHRELLKKNRELEQRLHTTAVVQQPAQLGKEPELEDFGYDTDKFKVAYAEWHEKKRKLDEQQASLKRQEEESMKAWQERLQKYEQAKTKIRVADFDVAEDVVRNHFSDVQQGIIVNGADLPAELIYAIGKNQKRAEELASIKDPVKFAFAIAKLETKLKVEKRSGPPAPERTIKGNAPSSGAVDKVLERLRAEADKSGDYSKVIAYKKKNRS